MSSYTCRICGKQPHPFCQIHGKNHERNLYTVRVRANGQQPYPLTNATPSISLNANTNIFTSINPIVSVISSFVNPIAHVQKNLVQKGNRLYYSRDLSQESQSLVESHYFAEPYTSIIVAIEAKSNMRTGYPCIEEELREIASQGKPITILYYYNHPTRVDLLFFHAKEYITKVKICAKN